MDINEKKIEEIAAQAKSQITVRSVGNGFDQPYETFISVGNITVSVRDLEDTPEDCTWQRYYQEIFYSGFHIGVAALCKILEDGEIVATRTPEDQNIRYRFPQSVIDDLKSAVKIFGSLSAEQDEQLGLKGGSYMSLESLLRRAESLPDGQEMWAVEDNTHRFRAVYTSEIGAEGSRHEYEKHEISNSPFKVVPVIVTKKEK